MIVIDSDVIIWLLRGDRRTEEKFREIVETEEGNVFVTAVQIAEIVAGMLPKERAAIESFLSSLGVLALDDKVGRLAGEFMNRYGKSHSVTLADALIAAATRLNGCDLWTKNRKHYPMLSANEVFTS
ncbi:MAG: type II toxin-antitoxin system VapC family toxin [bacterium]